jgi:hypothetical protein
MRLLSRPLVVFTVAQTRNRNAKKLNWNDTMLLFKASSAGVGAVRTTGIMLSIFKQVMAYFHGLVF